jgi:hypothetical protein
MKEMLNNYFEICLSISINSYCSRKVFGRIIHFTSQFPRLFPEKSKKSTRNTELISCSEKKHRELGFLGEIWEF